MARLKVNVLVTPAVNEAVAVTNFSKIISVVFAGVASGKWTIAGRLRGAGEMSFHAANATLGVFQRLL
jgi:hypothetical protein